MHPSNRVHAAEEEAALPHVDGSVVVIGEGGAAGRNPDDGVLLGKPELALERGETDLERARDMLKPTMSGPRWRHVLPSLGGLFLCGTVAVHVCALLGV